MRKCSGKYDICHGLYKTRFGKWNHSSKWIQNIGKQLNGYFVI